MQEIPVIREVQVMQEQVEIPELQMVVALEEMVVVVLLVPEEMHLIVKVLELVVGLIQDLVVQVEVELQVIH